MTELPKGWAEAFLPDFCLIEMGQAPSSSSYNTAGEGLPLYQGKAEFGVFYPKPKKFCTEPNKIGEMGSVLLSVRAPVGPTNIAPHRCAIGRGLAAILPLSSIPTKFVLWALRNQEHKIAAQATGSTFTAISKSDVHGIVVPLPPLNEQRRIVERIEAMFDEIDHGVENLKKARATLGLYRQSLLKSAFEGRLTAVWRARNADKLETRETLLARIQKERDTRYKSALDYWQKALTNWRENGEEGKKPSKPKRLPDFAFTVSQWETPWSAVRVEAILRSPLINGRSVKDRSGGFPVLRLTALKNGHVLLAEHKEGNWSHEDAEPFLVEKDDIFLARGNGSKNLVGIGGRVMEEPFPVAFPDTMIRVRLDPGAIRADFFLLAWNSWTVRSQIESAARTTAGIYKINQDHVSSFILPLPSLPEQAEIIRILDERLSAADVLKAEIDAGLARAEALRQSVLKQAFSGKLVPQDTEDEPAADLLARIRVEKATKPKKRRATDA